MTQYHAVVWLDHSEAHVFHLDVEDVEKIDVLPEHPHQKLHGKAGNIGSGRAPEDKEYYHSIAESLKGAQEILVVGPAGAKLQFIKHVTKHDHEVEKAIVGVETVDHPSDGQLINYAHRYFKAVDRMIG